MNVGIRDLIEAGVHFGHRVSRWNPAMAPYIYGRQNLIHIIDLRSTLKGIIRSANFLTRLVSMGSKDVLFVGTKRQAKTLIERESKRCGMHYVADRWLGGTLTNFHTIRERLKRLEELEKMEREGTIGQYSKKMISSLRRQMRKIQRNLAGVRNMEKLPGALVIVDIRKEHIALKEANILGIPVVAITDTDCDPKPVDICIPGNDDAYRAVEIVTKVLADAIIQGRDKYVADQAMEQKAAEDAAEDAGEDVAEDAGRGTEDPSPGGENGKDAEATN